MPNPPPDDIDLRIIDAGGPGGPLTAERAGRPIRPRWCVAAALLSLISALVCGALYLHRARPIVVTRIVSTPGQPTQDLTGCPIRTRCSYTDSPAGGGLFPIAERYLPGSELLTGSSVYDASTAAGYRTTVTLRTPQGVLVMAVAERSPGGISVPAWRSALPGTGPADLTLVVPGQRPGSDVAVSAHVPAGVAVPASALQRLAADPSLQLAGS